MRTLWIAVYLICCAVIVIAGFAASEVLWANDAHILAPLTGLAFLSVALDLLYDALEQISQHKQRASE